MALLFILWGVQEGVIKNGDFVIGLGGLQSPEPELNLQLSTLRPSPSAPSSTRA